MALLADQRIVTGLMNSWPEEPAGLVTGPGAVGGPSQRTSNDTFERTDTGCCVWNRALLILKKSLTRTSSAAIRALPSWRSTRTSSFWSGSVQNRPLG